MDNLSVCINTCLHLFHEMCSANFCAKYRKIKETTDFLHINRNSLFSRVCSLSLATCLSLSLSIPFPSLSFSQFPSSLSLFPPRSNWGYFSCVCYQIFFGQRSWCNFPRKLADFQMSRCFIYFVRTWVIGCCKKRYTNAFYQDF